MKKIVWIDRDKFRALLVTQSLKAQGVEVYSLSEFEESHYMIRDLSADLIVCHVELLATPESWANFCRYFPADEQKFVLFGAQEACPQWGPCKMLRLPIVPYELWHQLKPLLD